MDRNKKGHMARLEPRVRSIKRERNRYFSEKYLPNFVAGNVRKKERGKKEIKTSIFDSRSFVDWKSLGLITSTRATVGTKNERFHRRSKR